MAGVPRCAQKGKADPMRRKSDLPQRICRACGRPFTWRRKWKAVWEEVQYCSDRCRSNRGKAGCSEAGRA